MVRTHDHPLLTANSEVVAFRRTLLPSQTTLNTKATSAPVFSPHHQHLGNRRHLLLMPFFHSVAAPLHAETVIPDCSVTLLSNSMIEFCADAPQPPLLPTAHLAKLPSCDRCAWWPHDSPSPPWAQATKTFPSALFPASTGQAPAQEYCSVRAARDHVLDVVHICLPRYFQKGAQVHANRNSLQKILGIPQIQEFMNSSGRTGFSQGSTRRQVHNRDKTQGKTNVFALFLPVVLNEHSYWFRQMSIFGRD